MGDQIKGEDWLPEGWKVEIRVRKSGKKDRYYTDPVNGYIFRSLKDIDRYLLSGKLGKHVTKNKPTKNDLDSDNPKFDFIQHIDVPPLPKKKSIRSNVAKKVCQAAAEGPKRAKDESKSEKARAENPKDETVKKAVSRSSRGGRESARPKKKRESSPFFILDAEQCEDSRLSIPNLSDIIDSMLKEKEGSKTVYLSAPDIGSLLGEKLSENKTNSNNTNSNNYKKPKFAVSKCKDSGIISSNKLPCVPAEVVVKKDNLVTYDQVSSPVVQKSGVIMVAESKAKEETAAAECLQFDDLFDDPCIDFAIKTLTGTSPYGA